MSNSDELTSDIQDAVDDPTRSSDKIAFLAYLKKDLPAEVRAVYDTHNIWLHISEVGGTINNCRQLRVGEGPLPKQSRTHKHGDFDYRFETRSVRSVAYIIFCHPDIDDIWTDVRDCATGAAVTAVLAAILAGNYEVARATFYPVFYACLVTKIGERAKEVTVGFETKSEYGCWEYHC
ncbi:MAG: hypothetical protein GY775_02725 [Candidatus Scalindua sp.]|nr:hypothetical protein [Candidatus Scalindua sp.]